MPRTREVDRTVIRAPSALAELVHQEPDHAQVHLRVGLGESGALDAARVVTRAVAEARGRGVRDVDLTLDASAPSSGAVMEVLQESLVTHVDCLTLHREGPSLLVRVRLRGAPGVPPRGSSTEV